jgi:hypothetical protein
MKNNDRQRKRRNVFVGRMTPKTDMWENLIYSMVRETEVTTAVKHEFF